MTDRSKTRPRDPNQLARQIFLESIGELPKTEPPEVKQQIQDAEDSQGNDAYRWAVGKAIVMGLLERHGEARVKVITNRRRNHVVREIDKHVEPGSNLYTDSLQSYSGLTNYVIDHTEAYVRDKVIHTNGLENFWSLFKRAIKGTYVSVEPYHLQAYADEQAFRFNNRHVDHVDRFVTTVSQMTGRQITWLS